MIKNILIIFIMLFGANTSYSVNVIRDDEIENVIKSIAFPIMTAAKMNPDDFRIYIINDKTLNAFTAGGKSIFIHSGLFSKFDDPSVIQGVIAHELGHIIAGHILERKTQAKEIQKVLMISNAIGILGGIASNNIDLSMAGLFSSNLLAHKKMMIFSRQHENEADSIALDLLNKAKSSSDGLIKLLKFLIINERFHKSDSYMISHPLGQWRIDHIKSYKRKLGIDYNNHFSNTQILSFKRAIAKLKAYLEPTDDVLNIVSNKDDFISEYMKAILFYRQGKKEKAEYFIDKLANTYPKDPYILEIKGQIYMENGKFSISSSAYQEALKYSPNSDLLKFELAISKINLAGILTSKNTSDSLYHEAIILLNELSIKEEKNIQVYHYLSVSYGKLGNICAAKLAMAEKAMMIGNKKEVIKFATQALKSANPGSSEYIRAEDLLVEVKNLPI